LNLMVGSGLGCGEFVEYRGITVALAIIYPRLECTY
jgi:hypothetical protein